MFFCPNPQPDSMKSNLLSLFFFLLLVVFPTDVRAQALDFTDVPLARVGKSVITRKEFVARYELAPMLERTVASRTGANKLDFLLSMIAEKLLVQEAEARGVVSDSLFQHALAGLEALLVRDELYRREVGQKIRISEEEIAQAIRASQVDYKVYFVFSSTEEGAAYLSRALAEGQKLEEMRFPPDSSGRFEGPDSAIARWGDVDERMERVIYAMKLGQTSAPVHLADGYYIVKVMGKTVTVFEGDKDRKNARERVVRIMRKRKEKKRMFDYVAAALKNTRADANAKLFRKAVDAIVSILPSTNSNRSTGQFILSSVAVDSIRKHLNKEWDSVFVIFPHTQWTLGETIQRLSVSRFFVDNPTPLRMHKAFDQQLRDLIDREHLTYQGYVDKLHLTDAVRRDLRVWRDYLLADRFRQLYRDSVSVTRSDLKALIAFYRANEANRVLVKFQSLVVDSLALANTIVEKANAGESFTDMMYRYSNDEAAPHIEGRGRYVPLSSTGALRSVIDSLNIGEFSGPFATASGYAIVHLLDRKYAVMNGRDSLLLSDEEMRAEIRREKLQRFLTRSLAQYANGTEIHVYEKDLKETEVTHIPAMVYRFLGFGGRMFAVPFLDIQLDWVNDWVRRNVLLP